MSRKKIVFVIVEGPSDEDALGTILHRYYKDKSVYVEVMHCDITSDLSNKSRNIIEAIGNVVKKYARGTFKASYFSCIIHITDTDGVFIPDDAVVNEPSADEPFYSETEIRTCSKRNIEERNRYKRNNLKRLFSTGMIWNIPYKIYYMSCNLDHVLYDKLNSTIEDKKKDSIAFSQKYREDIPSFIEFISKSDFSVTGGYRESWQFISTECRSLERHSNFGLCFKEKFGE